MGPGRALPRPIDIRRRCGKPGIPFLFLFHGEQGAGCARTSNEPEGGSNSPDRWRVVTQAEHVDRGEALSEAAIRTLVEHSPDGIVMSDIDGRILFVNGEAEKLFARASTQLLGQPVETLIPDGLRDGHLHHRHTFAQRPTRRPMGVGLELEAQRGDGSTFPVEISLMPLSTDGHDVVIATVRDITERKAAADSKSELARLQQLADLVSFHRELTSAAFSGHGVEAIAHALGRATDRDVTIESPDGDLLASTNTEPSASLQPGAARRHCLAASDHAKAFRLGPLLLAVARPEGKILGVITLRDPDAAPDGPMAIALEQATTVLTLEVFRLRSIAEAELAVWGDLVSELLDDQHAERGRMHAQTFGYDMSRPHRAVVIKRTNSGVGSLLPAVRRALRRFDGAFNLIASRPAGVVLLVDHDLPWPAFAKAVSEENSGVHRVGVGSPRVIGDLRRSVNEAETALTLSQRLGRNDVVSIFDDLGVWRLFSANADPAYLEDFVREWLQILIDYDMAHQSDLMRTLSTFLEGDRNYEATARMLFIHRSTLRYRLKRIEELSGRSLENSDDRFNLSLACRAWISLDPGGALLPPGDIAQFDN